MQAQSFLFDPGQTAAMVQDLSALLQKRKWRCSTAESCTGGLIGAALTAFPGSSAWYWGGVVAYDNQIKHKLLGVPSNILEREGAVSEAVVKAMALGACRNLGLEAAMSVSGIAGPDGGSPDKPVGTVWLGYCICPPAGPAQLEAQVFCFPGERQAVRLAAMQAAILGLTRVLGQLEA